MIGGFATGTVNEDTHTSLRFNAAGFHGIFHAEVLALGLAPVDSDGYYGQRQRFAHGAMQIFFNEPLLRQPGLAPMQRKVFFFHVVANIEGWRYLAIYLLPVIMLVTGDVPLATTGATFVLFFVPYAALAWIATELFSRGHAHVFQTAVYNLARVPASVRATFTGRRMGRVFRVTPKMHTQRRRPAEELFPWCVAIASFAAIVYAVAHTVTGRPLLATDALVILSLWAGYHAVTAIRLIALAQRCR